MLNMIDIARKSSEIEERGITHIKGLNKEIFVSYKKLFSKALYILYNLQQNNIVKGQQLIFQMPDNEDFLNVFWACILGGIIPVPVSVGNNDEYRTKVLKIWSILDNPCLIATQTTLDSLVDFVMVNNCTEVKTDELKRRTILLEDLDIEVGDGTICEDVKSDDIAFIQFSSGSTGDPKGVILTHENLITNIAAINKAWDHRPTDVSLSWMPLTHDMGLICVHLTAIATCIDQYLIPTGLFIRHPTLWIQKAHEYKANRLFSPNFGYKYFLLRYNRNKAIDWDLSHVRFIANGAEPICCKLCHEFLNEMRKYGLKRNTMLPVYGLAEATVGVARPPLEEELVTFFLHRDNLGVGEKVKIVSEESQDGVNFVDLGYTIDNVELRICDQNNNILDEEYIGYVQLRGKSITRGYYNNQLATDQVLTDDGWLNTGDLGFLKNHRLVLTGRAKDIIFVNGQNYYPYDIERVAEDLEYIELGKVVACGVPSKKLDTEEIVLFVLSKEKLKKFVDLSTEIKKLISEKMGLMISQVIPVRKIPKTTSGKIQRFKLKESYMNGEFLKEVNELNQLLKNKRKIKEKFIPIAEIELNLVNICNEILQTEEVGLDNNFFDLGVNSVRLTQIAGKIEDIYPDQVNTSDFFKYPTIREMAQYIRSGKHTKEKVIAQKEKSQANKEVAIIGISLKLPKSSHLEEYWENLKAGRDCITSFPYSRRVHTDAYLRYRGKEEDRIGYLPGGYLDEIDKFDYNFFKITPKEASLMDPVQRLFLESAWEAIEDAGYGGHQLTDSSTGVYLGFIGDEEEVRYRDLIAQIETEAMRKISVTGNLSSITTSRISYILNLKGPTMLIDTACSSSLVAVHLACQALRSGECDQAIAAGIRLSILPQEDKLKIGIESSDGKAKAFDDYSEGTGLGEGVLVVFLKPLSKAIADHDHIYAVIKGSAINQDGSSNGITAPNAFAQANVINKAWEDAEINPETITYIEAHGTGTKLGDPIEIEGIKMAFEGYTDKKQFCAISSVKSNIGHLFAGAGLAGLIKCVLALQNKQLPPQVHFTKPNQEIDFVNSPVYVNTTLSKWEVEQLPRRCGISSFGFSGTNCHMILEEYEATTDEDRAGLEGERIFTLSAKTFESLNQLIYSYKSYLEAHPEVCLADLCYTANIGRGHYDYRLAIIAKSVEDLKNKLTNLNFDEKQKHIYFNKFKVVVGNQEALALGELTELERMTLTSEVSYMLDSFADGKHQSLSMYEEICYFYIRGAEVEWERLYSGKKTRRVSLPTYPFARSSCWLNIPEVKDSLSIKNNMYHTIKWKKYYPEKKITQIVNETIMIVTSDLQIPFSLSLKDKLSTQGNRIIEVEWGTTFTIINGKKMPFSGKQDDYLQLMQVLKKESISKIIFFPTLFERPVQSSSQLGDRLVKGVFSLYNLIWAMDKNQVEMNLEIILIADYVNQVTSDEEMIKPEHATFFGLAGVVAKEIPTFRFKSIDIDQQTSIDVLLSEIARAVPDSRFTYTSIRENQFYTRELAMAQMERVNDRHIQIKEDGVYVIAGGAGGIGLEIANHLARNTSVNLVLINRSEIPDREEWNEVLSKGENQQLIDKIDQFKEIEENGSKIIYYSADISKYQEISSVLTQIREKYGKIDGVINAAGILGYKTLLGMSFDELFSILAPKVLGSWNLDQLTRNDQLDFFILFSSVASLMGSSGQSGYAAANAYLDSLTASRNKDSLNTFCINWGIWKNTGMATDIEWTDTIFKGLSKEKALQAFDTIMASAQHQVIVGELNYQSRMINLLTQYPFTLSEEIDHIINKQKMLQESTKAKDGEMVCQVQLKGKSEEEDYTAIEKKLGQICSKILGFSEIGIYDNFFEIGADSILLTQIYEELRKEYETITMTDFFSYPSVAKLAKYIGESQGENEVKDEVVDSKDWSEKDIAIIGMASKFPEAENLDEFWEHLASGRDLIREFPEDRKNDIAGYLYNCGEDQDVKFFQAGYLKEIDKFDHKFFRLTPKEASLMDPNQRLFLETAWNAIEDAGYSVKSLDGSRTGIYVGFSEHPRYTYGRMVFDLDPDVISLSLVGNIPSVLPSRLSYLLNLRGPSMVIDTACSSSLTAIHLACQSIKNGDCDQAIAGGVKINLIPLDKESAKIGIESSDYRTKAFDDSSDGTGIGEGVGAIFLKPLHKAIKDRDPIYAVIKGSAINQDGASVGLTAPNSLAQTEVILDAWKHAEINPETITYIEAHGTGTNLGDPIEVDGIQRAFRKYTERKQFCAISSVKTNIGHLFECAGIASVIKAVLSLKHKKLLANIHFNEPNNKIDFINSPVYVNDQLLNWDTDSLPRRCGVSAFGLSGTNCHLILEEPPEIVIEGVKEISHPMVITLSAKNENVLKKIIDRQIQFVNTEPFDLLDLAYTLNVGRKHYSCRLAIIVHDEESYKTKLDQIRAKLETSVADGIYYGNFKVASGQRRTNAPHEITESEVRKISQMANEKASTFIAEAVGINITILLEICQLYIKGAEIDWQLFYQNHRAHRMHLPTYPFEETRCWVQIPKVKSTKTLITEISEQLKELVVNDLDQTKILEEGADELKEYSSLLVLNYFTEMNIFTTAGQRYCKTELQNQLSIIKEYSRLFEAMLEILQETQYIEVVDDQVMVTFKVQSNDVVTQLKNLNAFQEKLMQQYEDQKPYLNLLKSCSDRFKEILTGKVPATNVIFPNYSMDLVEKIYKGNRLANYFNNMIAKYIKMYLENRTKQRGPIIQPIRILEIGAGTGGTSEFVLKELLEYGQNLEYVYTDISIGFLEYGRKQFGKYPFVVFELLNIEHDVEVQGYSLEAFDIILATNVIHATRNIENTMTKVKKLLKQNGLLLLNEITKVQPFATLTFGLLDGWWMFKDQDIRLKNSPLLNCPTWRKILNKLGFSNVDTIEPMGMNKKQVSQSIIIGEKVDSSIISQTGSIMGKTTHKMINKSNVSEIKLKGRDENNYTETEIKVGQIFTEILGYDEIDVYTSFYDMGGDSILALRISNQIQSIMNEEMNLTDLLNNATIAEIAATLDKHVVEETQKGTNLSIKKLEKRDYYPLSAAQKRIFVIEQITDTGIGYNVPEVLLLKGELNPAKFQEAFQILIKRHESLRTSFTTIDGEPVQIVHDNVGFQVEYVQTLEGEIDQIINDFIEPFNLNQLPLFRAKLVRLNKLEHIFIFDIHHIIIDGGSNVILMTELLKILEDTELEDIPIQYKDFAVWQNQILESESMNEKENYWFEQFTSDGMPDVPVLEMPTDFQRPPFKDFAGDRVNFWAEAQLTAKLKALAVETKTTLNMVLLAVYTILLSKYSGQEDIVIGSPVLGRNRAELQNVVGMFVNMLALRNCPEHQLTFNEFLVQVKEISLRAYENQDYQFDSLVKKLNLKRDLARNPLFDYVFAVQNYSFPDLTGSNLNFTLYEFGYKISRFDMFLSVYEESEQLRFSLEYATTLYKRETIEQFKEHYLEILRQVIGNIDFKLDDIILSHEYQETDTSIFDDEDDFDF